MNSKLIIAVPVLALALGACGTVKVPAVHVGASRASALPTSSAAREAKTAVKDSLATCLPAGQAVDQAFLVTLATSNTARQDLADSCKIPLSTRTHPQHNRLYFVEAVAASAGNAYYKGDFKTAAGRDDWGNKVFPIILEAFRK